MNPAKGLLALTAILAVGLFGFFLYSNSQSEKSAPQIAVVVDSIEENFESPSTTTQASPRPILNGFKETELQQGLESIKSGLELLQNPFE